VGRRRKPLGSGGIIVGPHQSSIRRRNHHQNSKESITRNIPRVASAVKRVITTRHGTTTLRATIKRYATIDVRIHNAEGAQAATASVCQ